MTLDICRNCHSVVLAKSGCISYPFDLLSGYFKLKGTDLSSSVLFLKHYVIVNPEVLYLKKDEYFLTSTLEIVLRGFCPLFATAVTDAGVNDGLFKCHGRCSFSQDYSWLCQRQFNCFVGQYQRIYSYNSLS